MSKFRLHFAVEAKSMRGQRLLKRLLSGGSDLSRKKERAEGHHCDGDGDDVTSMDDLPVDVQLVIVTFCDIHSVCNLASLNRRWNEMLKRPILWRQLCGRDFDIVILPSAECTWHQVYKSMIPFDRDEHHFQRCFYGAMRVGAANTTLFGRPRGSFIFRGSSRGDRELSWVDERGRVRHNRMRKTLEGYVGDHWEDETPYTSLGQIMSNHPELTNPLYDLSMTQWFPD
ncbi:F-box only protein 4-like [Planoprotostelium fungivorum]|uniref:F-box only protein 4-like n=1 Tax=Planoprotostelium fungivorum TaxID=1890364 RepID=A0A2P6NIA6_9EUKA|nr:F-box only protein 4-like [Planoprotostelium fungivorum]